MQFEIWLLYLLTCFGIAVVPGPNALLVLTHGALHGNRKTLFTISGGVLGFIAMIALCVLGLGALLKTSMVWLTALKIVGGLYLIWLGIGMLRSRKLDPQQVVAAPQLSDWQALRIGFLTNALNPKTTLFVVALFTQVISPDTATLTQLGYGLFMAVAHLFWFALVAYGLSSEAARGFVARSRHQIERAIGGVLVALGLGLAASSLQRS